MQSFYVAEHQNDVDEMITRHEFNIRPSGEFQPNRHWCRVDLRDEASPAEWLELQRERLQCSWTPKQSSREREENGQRIREIMSKQSQLEELKTEITP